MVEYQGKCFVAKNNPGSWSSPTGSGWFWDEVSCGNTPAPTNAPVTDKPTVPTAAPTQTPPTPTDAPVTGNEVVWVAGSSRVSNGDRVIYQGECFEARNNPGIWEAPKAGSWFWTPVTCSGGVAPTAAPTTAPTVTPTVAPTAKPTIDPTVEPTPLPPTVEPTVAPTVEPTVLPTLEPSVAPSVEPTLPPEKPGELTILPDNAGTGYTIPRAELSAVEYYKTDSPLFRQVKFDISTRDNAIVEATAPNNAMNPENVLRVEGILSEQQWDYFFPLRNEAYTYKRFLQAVAKFPAFCQTYTDGRDSEAICKRSIATMFAHFGQETGANAPNWVQSKGVELWRQGLYYLREMYKSEDVVDGTYSACGSWQGEKWPCAPGKSYFGRGAKQLSWNYNYGQFSQAMFGDINVLLEKPELVADTWLNLASAVFFFVTPQPPKPSMLHVIDGTWQPNAADKAANLLPGLGATIQIINGAYECGKGGAEDYRAANRIKYYKIFAEELNLDITGEPLSCANMKAFATDGAGALLLNWDKDWGYNGSRPGDKSFECKPVGYQTAYNALFEGDYEQCVEKHFNVQAVDENGVIIPKGQ
ncbi:chitin-binding protein [Motilimonas pumila]|uniref:Chitin-binding protein n=2 Tax=Motilimonas pumila TaxID=2303987 RepID=A0A418YAS2_9GAMM|nr:chitin-binding protein [Motilimonas pumila]